MIKSRIKTIIIILLLVLLGINIFLLFKQNYVEEKEEITVELEKTDIDISTLKANKIMFSEDNQNTFFLSNVDKKIYESLINYFIKTLRDEYVIEELHNVDALYKDKKIITFFYQSSLNRDLFVNPEDFYNADIDFEKIKNISFIISEKPYIVIYTGERYLLVKSEATDNLDIAYLSTKLTDLLYSQSLRYKNFYELISKKDNEKVKANPNLLFPSRGYYMLAEFSLSKEYNFDDLNECTRLINNIFAAKAPFLKEAKNLEGDKIYLSEYGDEVLNLSVDGSIEYEAENTEKPMKTTLRQDFLTALDFNSKISKNEGDIRLVKVVEKENGKYFERKFCFDRDEFKTNYYSKDDENGLCIVVNSGKVTLYKRNLPFVKILENSKKSGKTYLDNTIISILEKKDNFSKLEKLYRKNKEQTLPIDYDEKLNFIISEIDDFSFAYYKNKDGNISPCYKITIGDGYLLIDFYEEKEVSNELG